MGKRELRMNRLVDLIRSHGYMPIKDIAQAFRVSEMTVRRDLAIVEKSGLIKNVNGVVISGAARPEERQYDFDSETKIQNEVKELIGRRAAELIAPGECVIFDVGTTTEQIARNIPPSLEFEAICYSQNILRLLCGEARVTLSVAGGFYHPDTQAFSSDEGVAFIRNMRANKMFVSAAGVHSSLGVSCANAYEVALKRVSLQSARQHILVADSSKFDEVRSAYFCDLADIHIVVTDGGLPPSWRDLFRQMGIQLILV